MVTVPSRKMDILMKRLLILLFCLINIITVTAQHGDDIPYIYYYSHVLNGIVIERADGTDSRIIGQGLVEETDYPILFVEGAGWSPNGNWFAWRSVVAGTRFSASQGYVVNVDGENRLEWMRNTGCVLKMWWHPTDDLLLVVHNPNGSVCNPNYTPTITYTLFDMNTQARLATFSVSYDFGRPLSIYWGHNHLQFQGSLVTDYEPQYTQQNFLVRMFFDGNVSMETITEEETLENPIISNSFDGDSQSGLLNYQLSDTVDRVPSPPRNNSAVGGDVSVVLLSIENWFLVGYEFCVSGCGGITERVNVYNPLIGHNREISSCGSHFSCVNWLPDRVNVNDLPTGQDYSVLPAPDVLNFDNNEYDFGLATFTLLVTHEITCESGQDPAQVKDLETGDIVFTLPNRQHCGEPENGVIPPLLVIFAVSPDHQYYAITNNSEFTALYHADTGNLIARFNFYGIRLAFSEDSTQLITSGRFAEATWDIQRLIEQYEMP